MPRRAGGSGGAAPPPASRGVNHVTILAKNSSKHNKFHQKTQSNNEILWRKGGKKLEKRNGWGGEIQGLVHLSQEYKVDKTASVE